MQVPLISLVLLSHNRPQFLASSLPAVAAQRYPNLEVIVVDNRSPASQEIAELVGRHPNFRLIALDDNRGFTGGMNVGIAAARGHYTYLTEDDVELAPDVVLQLGAHLDAHPDVGLVGPIMVNRRGQTVRCAGGHVDIGSVYRLSIMGVGQSPDAFGSDAPYAVGFLPGAAVMARTDLLRELGGFRHEFFMYQEDVEVCTRVRRRGLSIHVVPSARVFHFEPGECDRAQGAAAGATVTFHKTKNLPALYLMHAEWHVLPSFFVRYGMVGAVRALFQGQFRLHVRAWAWALWRAPGFLARRARTRALSSPS